MEVLAEPGTTHAEADVAVDYDRARLGRLSQHGEQRGELTQIELAGYVRSGRALERRRTFERRRGIRPPLKADAGCHRHARPIVDVDADDHAPRAN